MPGSFTFLLPCLAALLYSYRALQRGSLDKHSEDLMSEKRQPSSFLGGTGRRLSGPAGEPGPGGVPQSSAGSGTAGHRRLLAAGICLFINLNLRVVENSRKVLKLGSHLPCGNCKRESLLFE